MAEEHTADFHLHLNGSFSLDFLKQKARQNNCPDAFEQFVKTREHYLEQTKTQPEEGYNPELIKLVWKLFALTHQIIQNLEDIFEGVEDVVKHSKAKYLEIRTTPKAMADGNVDDYITSFEQGLKKAREKCLGKQAIGLLSLDRTKHTLDDAKHFIERIKQSPSQLIKGLDVSGNPSAKRSLTGKSLEELVTLCLNENIPIALHMGETPAIQEQHDTDTILTAIENWASTKACQTSDLLYGKVRLGHCIYLSEEQKSRIKQLHIPIEVCPTCHRLLNWHLDSEPHPVTTIYEDISEELVAGTDDETEFGASAKGEFNKLLSFFANKHALSRADIKAHQARFRFAH